ncbi:MAG: leucine-rich repeat domain-containing protein, partial [Muribaculaceae bacterium]|nr:leucine-rich repeat domain-containing protein [Muribaculaceae bacterium]
IGEKAFYACQKLTGVYIPDNVTSIGGEAFAQCYKLESVTLPIGLTSIPNQLFEACESLKEIDIPFNVGSIGPWAFYDCDAMETISFYEVASLGEGAFFGCGSLRAVDLGYCLKEIGKGVFASCQSLTGISLPATVESIGENAFSNCMALERINVDEENPYFASKDNTLYDKDFSELILGASAVTELTIPETTVRIRNSAFYNGKLTSVQGGEGLIEIDDYAFSGCRDLASFNFSDKLERIGDEAFAMAAFTEVDLPETLTQLSSYAFSDNHNLTSIIIPDKIESIGSYCFFRALSLTDVTIGPNVGSIGEYAFYGCEALKHITCQAVKPPYYSSGFPEAVYPVATLSVPDDSRELYSRAEVWGKFKNIKGIGQSGINRPVAYGINITAEGRTIYVDGNYSSATVYGADGRVAAQIADGNCEVNSAGCYIVRATCAEGVCTAKIIVR